MAPASGQIYQVTYQQILDGQTLENVIHFRERTGTSTPAQIATSVQGFLVAMAQIQTNNVVYSNIIVKQMTPLAFDESFVTPSVTTGAQSSAVFNNVVSMVFTKRTGVAGKRHRGRIYVGGVPLIFATDPNRLNTTGTTATGTFISTVMGAYGETGTDAHLAIGVYSRLLGGTNPFTVAGWQQLTGIDSQVVFGTQRRRRVGVGI